MGTDRLITVLQEDWRLPTDICRALGQRWERRHTLRRGDFLIRQGQTEDHLYFIQEGTLRIYYEIGENEVCVGFGYPSTFICSFPSFISLRPSEYYIQALRRTEVIGIGRTAFYELVTAHPELERVWRQLMEQALLGRIEREIDLLTPAPADRLRRLLDRSPQVFQRIPQKYIASYLGMTAETLSRTLKDLG